MFMKIFCLEDHVIHREKIEQEWKEENLLPFDELIFSWNAKRPSQGAYHIYVRVKMDEWSPWLQYASWKSDGQTSYHRAVAEAPFRVYQDAVEIMEGRKATGFQIRIDLEGNATLGGIHGMHIYTNGDRMQVSQDNVPSGPSIYLDVAGLSQMSLNHVRYKSLCSPSATTAVVRYLTNQNQVDPLAFAEKSWDSGFDIFGNWIFNIAQASVELGPMWNAWVERLHGFASIYQYLKQGTPVVVSVRSPLPGSAQVYEQGHLIAVIGYDPVCNEVLCMDPAFSRDQETHVRYFLTDFVQAWNRRGRIAYVFEKK